MLFLGTLPEPPLPLYHLQRGGPAQARLAGDEVFQPFLENRPPRGFMRGNFLRGVERENQIFKFPMHRESTS